MKHSSLERIFDAVRGGEGPADDLTRHLTECARCAESAAWVREVLPVIDLGPLPEPTAEALDRAIAIPETTGRLGRQVARRVSWSLARLLPNAFARPAMAGVRGGSTPQRSLYEVDGAHLDLEIAAAPGDAELRRLVGQLVIEGNRQAEEVLAVLWRDSDVAARAVGDELGVFVLDDVVPGTYRLEVLSPSTGHAVRVTALAVDEAG